MNIDIVNLIENNPITKFNGNYQNKLINKIKNNFTSYEQQIFISSFYCYLNFHNSNDYVINFDDVWKWIGFSQKIKAKQLLEKYFEINKDYKLYNYSDLIKNNIDIKSGHNKDTILLNIKTFKLFCIKAGTLKANELHEYFVKLEEILLEVIQEESNELKLQLENKNNELTSKNNELKLIEIKNEENIKKTKILEREKILLNEYGSIGSIVYIIKVKTFENGQYIIKIGESRKGISLRYNEHKHSYDECLLLDCFLVEKSKDFESFLHNHESIRLNRVNDLPGHETEVELFLIGKNLSYKTVLNIIDNNLKYFNNVNTTKLELEVEQLKMQLELKENNTISTDLINLVKLLSAKIDNLEKTNKEILNKLNSLQTKTTNNFNEPLTTLGPRLQKFNPDTLELIRVYESVSECIKENPKLKRPSISKAVQENTIYQGFRWQLIDRELDPYSITNIEPTKPTIIKNTGYIAKINSTKTEIVNVYIDRKTAALLNGHSSASALDTPFAKGTISNGHYYTLYEKCDENLIEDFEEIHGTPLLYKSGIGKYDENKELVEEYECKKICYQAAGISDKSLARALDNGIMYNGFYYKYLGEKLSML